jgi:hypothetical protein
MHNLYPIQDTFGVVLSFAVALRRAGRILDGQVTAVETVVVRRRSGSVLMPRPAQARVWSHRPDRYQQTRCWMAGLSLDTPPAASWSRRTNGFF